MRMVYVVGIGAGNPEHITVEAVRRISEVDVFLFIDKGEQTRDLAQARREIIRRYAGHREYRVVERQEVSRDRRPSDYEATIRAWHAQRADLYEELLVAEVAHDQCAGILAWGDPTLYDNTTSVLEEVNRRGNVPFRFEVVPGVSSVAALTAAFRTTVNRVGQPVQVTTGRRLLADGFPEKVDDVVVMLDSSSAFTQVDPAAEIFWGAYVGTPDEILIKGRVGDVAQQIVDAREEARDQKGWIMDLYLLRR